MSFLARPAAELSVSPRRRRPVRYRRRRSGRRGAVEHSWPPPRCRICSRSRARPVRTKTGGPPAGRSGADARPASPAWSAAWTGWPPTASRTKTSASRCGIGLSISSLKEAASHGLRPPLLSGVSCGRRSGTRRSASTGGGCGGPARPLDPPAPEEDGDEPSYRFDPPSPGTPETELRTAERSRLLLDLADQVAAGSRNGWRWIRAIRLRYCDGFTFPRIADEMHVTERTAQRYVEQGQQAFRAPARATRDCAGGPAGRRGAAVIGAGSKDGAG